MLECTEKYSVTNTNQTNMSVTIFRKNSYNLVSQQI